MRLTGKEREIRRIKRNTTCEKGHYHRKKKGKMSERGLDEQEKNRKTVKAEIDGRNQKENKKSDGICCLS